MNAPMTMHHVRTLLLFLVAAVILAGACLLRAEAPVVAPLPLASASVNLADRAAVAAAPTPLTHEQLLRLLTRDLAAHFNLEGDLQLDLIRAWTPPAHVAAVWDLEVLDYPSVAASSMIVRCRIVADAAPIAEATFVLRAALWRDVWAARMPLPIGGVFDPAQLEARRVDTLRERDALPAAVGDSSYIFARGVAAGYLLTWRDVARRPLVKKGEIVEVSAADGRLLVTMKAMAMENGARGDTVTVRNPESQKNFAAMVIDENRVQVRF
ncbi:MAG TPA: flagellar basal body P-ring formation chaperone FlgA [Opitutaceae bacterium]|nr:flagellar basal body P-ring formation chaperone FlgA [Opitutaceae bacterium]